MYLVAMSDFGRWLKDAREQKKLSQQELGEAVGVISRTVSRWETGRGKPTRNTTQRIARLFDVDERELRRAISRGEGLKMPAADRGIDLPLLELKKLEEYAAAGGAASIADCIARLVRWVESMPAQFRAYVMAAISSQGQPDPNVIDVGDAGPGERRKTPPQNRGQIYDAHGSKR